MKNKNMSVIRLPSRYKKIGLLIILIGVLFIVAGMSLTWLGYTWEHLGTDVTLPFYSPFVDIAQYTMIIGLLVWVFAKEKIEDEYVQKLRLESFYQSLLITAILVILNEGIYFFGDMFIISGIHVILVQLLLNVVVLKMKLLK